jgi:hypothetical protein
MRRTDERRSLSGWTTWTVVALTVALAGGCADTGGAQGSEGGCNGRIRYEGVVYRPHNAVNESAPPGKALGDADVIGCGGISAEAVDTVRLYAVEGVDPDVAVTTDDAEWGAVYVAEAVPQKSWPPELRRHAGSDSPPTHEQEAAYAETLPPTGEPVTFYVYTHCGVESARIGGRWWSATNPLYDESGGSAPPGWGDPYQEGRLTVESSERAVFEAEGAQIVFVPSASNEPTRICK